MNENKEKRYSAFEIYKGVCPVCNKKHKNKETFDKCFNKTTKMWESLRTGKGLLER